MIGRFDAPGGLKGYAAMIQQQPLAIYLNEEPLQRLVSKPTTFYKDASGSVQTIQGAPPAEMLSKAFGPR